MTIPELQSELEGAAVVQITESPKSSIRKYIKIKFQPADTDVFKTLTIENASADNCSVDFE
jgi:hypothetical protein